MVDAKERAEVEVFGFCLMSNHWHMVVRPRRDQDLARYFSWLTNTHVKRYRAHYRRTSGHLYQGRYKSFVVQEDGHLLTLLRYVEANPLRAKMVERAQDWHWSSLGCQKELARTTARRLADRPPAELDGAGERADGSGRRETGGTQLRAWPAVGKRSLDPENGRPDGAAVHSESERQAEDAGKRQIKTVDVTLTASLMSIKTTSNSLI